jgi:hypothetical protein
MPRKLSRKHTHFRPTVFKLMQTEDKLTAASGLGTIIEVFDESTLSQGFKESLPTRRGNRSAGGYRLGLIQLASFIYGHDCLDDLEEFRDDPLIEEVLKGEVPAPRTIGDFLRDFSDEHIQKLNAYLARMSLAIRAQLKEVQPDEYKPGALRIDMDSTSHEQCAEQMEGLAWNYKNEWCLDSQVVFDELGFCHGAQLRPGNTKSGVDADLLMKNCFSSFKHGEEKYFSADSAYCNQSVIRACLLYGAKFTLTAHDATTGWRELSNQVMEWTEWKYSELELKKAEKRGKTLPRIELGRVYYQPGWSDGLRFPIVVKRTWNEIDGGLFTTQHGFWDYYAVVTNWDLFRHPLQEVMQFHQKRGNAENFIREEKYGYDLKHFPCKDLRANHAFLLLALIAHNLLRWMALVYKPDKPHFSKKLRRRFVFIPGKIVKHARQIVLKIPTRFYEEVNRMRLGLRFNPDQSAFASGFS